MNGATIKSDCLHIKHVLVVESRTNKFISSHTRKNRKKANWDPFQHFVLTLPHQLNEIVDGNSGRNVTVYITACLHPDFPNLFSYTFYPFFQTTLLVSIEIQYEWVFFFFFGISPQLWKRIDDYPAWRITY